MKKCLRCGQTFTDDNSFCLMDGSPLTVISEPDKTLSFSNETDVPTQIVSVPQRAVSQPAGTIPGWVYLIIGVLGTALIASVAFIFLLQGKEPAETSSVSKSDPPEVTGSVNRSAEAKPPEPANSGEDATFKDQKPEIQPPAVFASPAGNWVGDWSSKSTAFKATAFFRESNGKIEGEINWNLMRTTNPKKIGKVGSSATEYVRGTFNPQTGRISLRGYRKDDPANIVILDRYNLSMTRDNQQISGRSINGNFILRR